MASQSEAKYSEMDVSDIKSPSLSADPFEFSDCTDGTSCSCEGPSDSGAKRLSPDEDIENIDMATLKSKYNPEYNLRKRTIVTRLKTEKKRNLPKEPKPKSNPAPLSKYRRRAANARERTRMKDLNVGFEELKEVIPNIESAQRSKMTKVTVLRLAMNYISALRQTLGYDEGSSTDFNSDGDSIRSSSVSSGDETSLSPLDGDILSTDFSTEELDLMYSDLPEDVL